jgi:CHAT domain-containing protein
VRSGGNIERFDFPNAGDIDDAVAQLHTALDDVDPDFRATAGEVANHFRPTLERRLKAERLLIIAADGSLHRLPWAVLPGEDGRPWVEKMAFCTVPDAQSLLASDKPNAPTGAQCLVSLGGCEYGQLEKTFPQLPAMLTEAKEVAEIYARNRRGADQLLIREKATKTQLLNALAHARYVHLATHGDFLGEDYQDRFGLPSPQSSLDSFLVLAEEPEGKSEGDQLLTAAEVRMLDLRSTDLVMLSACETGLGGPLAGQGVLGLVEAFHQAGARTVVSALWKVSDEAALRLSQDFYSELWRTNQAAPAFALRAAQLKMLHGEARSASGKRFDHPKYWAAFTVSGDPGRAADE